MIYFIQTLSLKVRFVGVLLLAFPVVGFQWLVSGAPWALARLKVLSGGVGMPDQAFWYDPHTLQQWFTAWGVEGRQLYLTVLFPSDLGFLVAYGLLLSGASLYLLKKSNPANAWWYLLPLVPAATAGADLLENLTVALAVLIQPWGWEPVSWSASFFTASKWCLLVATLAVLLGGAVTHWVRRARTSLGNALARFDD